jgi:hypothetical protein
MSGIKCFLHFCSLYVKLVPPMKNLSIICSLVSVFIISCSHVQQNKTDNIAVVAEDNNFSPKIEIRIFRNDTIPGSGFSGYGYDIMVEGKPHIHQPHIPAVSGSSGFLSEEDARKTAEYVAERFKKTKALPSLSKQELDSLGIKFN